MRLPPEFFQQELLEVARQLLGKVLLKDGVGGPIVEVEAYHQDEPACHGHRGRTARNASLFLAGGRLYVYRIHQSVCANVVTGREAQATAVLLRGLLPVHGRPTIARRRRRVPERAWTDGPGKLCRALAIVPGDDGRELHAGPISVEDRGLVVPPGAIGTGPRIGISRATELPWRFLVDRAGQAALRAQALENQPSRAALAK